MPSPIADYLARLHADLSSLDAGALADYIPELAKAERSDFGICIVTLDGIAYSAGDADKRFTIQSISKPFVYAAALADRGQAFVSGKVGVEPSGDAFNSISLDPKTGAPKNPMINAGAIASTSLVRGDTADSQWQRIRAAMAAFIGREVEIEESIYRSESETGHRNRAIAWMLKNFGIIDHDDPMAPLENYFRQCSILVDCRDLAMMAVTLANRGVNPVTGQRALPAELTAPVLSVMATCGMYDYAGSWLYEVGMPAKSGVGGGIIAVLPGRFGIGIYSPLLDAKGNSVRGIEVCKRLSQDLQLNVFSHSSQPSMALSRVYTAAEVPSKRHYPAALRARIDPRASRIKYYTLHGPLAADGAEFITRRMLALADDSDCCILDLHQVTQITDSAARLFGHTHAQLAARGIAVVYSRLHGRESLRAALRRGMRAVEGPHGFLSFEDNDLAVQWCERRLIEADGDVGAEMSFAEAPLFRGLSAALLAQVEAMSWTEHYAKGDLILTAGQQNDRRIFAIESGFVSILLPLMNGDHHRIESMGPGSNFGELILLGATARSASASADSDVLLRVLDADDVHRLSATHPELKIALLENLARDVTYKLRRTNQSITALG